MKTAALRLAALKPELNQIVFLALAAAFIFSMSSARAAPDDPVGKVRATYVETSHGVRIEQTRAQAPQSARRWADIDFGPSSAQPRRLVTVQLPQALKAERGDLVQVSLTWPAAVDKSTHAPLIAASRATLVTAKWFTLQADTFDRSPLASVSRLRAASPIF